MCAFGGGSPQYTPPPEFDTIKPPTRADASVGQAGRRAKKKGRYGSTATRQAGATTTPKILQDSLIGGNTLKTALGQ